MRQDRQRGTGIGAWVLVIAVGLPGRAHAKPFERPVKDVIETLEDPARIKMKQPEKVVQVMAPKPGEVVADVGAGTGLYAFLLAAAVGSAGKVYAVEIDDELLGTIRKKIEEQHVTNVVVVKSSPLDPMLPEACCDQLLVANAFHHLDHPVRFMKHAKRALKPGGRVTIVSRILPPPAVKLFVNAASPS